MSISHTPGPWKTYKDGVHPVLEDGSNGNDSFAICQCFGPDALHNQRLIAAAPELLTAVIQYRDDLRHPIDEDSRQRRLAMVEALISKATSRQPEGER